jgi:Tol biopolymer transport system component
MPLAPGTRLGAYEIVSSLGAGGMGEVYRARDTRLGRDVAIKILPELFASDPERLTRFEQEARAAAALNHPNIAAVYDVGTEGETRYIVQEYLAGSSLRDVMTAERSKPIREWASMAAAIADALAAAHRAGIVHRDIKPENVIVTEDGHPKVLDFGLAKLAEPGAEGVSANSPTMMGTMAGAVLGTIGYMSPEQAAGQSADRRTDIFALGCILYEMIAGRRPFEGRSAAEVIAHLLHDEPAPLAELRADVPDEIARLVSKCLVKEPARRYQHADDLAVDLRDAETHGDRAHARSRVPAPVRGLATPWWIAIVVAAAALAALVTESLAPAAAGPRSVIRFETPVPPISATYNRVLAVSPDGRFVASTATVEGSAGLVIRSLDDPVARPLAGAAEARDPAFSPDSRNIVFWSADQIRRIPVDGGPIVSVGPSPGRPLGLSWSDDGFIYYGRGREGIWRMPAVGGTPPEQVKAVEESQYAHGPQRLPGSDWIVFTRASRVNGWNDAQIVAARLGSDEERVIVAPGHDARWVPGFLTYVHDSQLFAVPFDERAVATTGERTLVAEGLLLASMDMTGAAFYGVSESGVLAYFGGPGADEQRMVWQEGQERTPLPVPPGRISQVSLAPDGQRVAARVFDGGWHIFWYDVNRPSGTKVTSDGSNRNPVWSPDGEWIYFASDRNGELDVWRRRADLAGDAELVYAPAGNQMPVGLTPDGFLIFISLDPNGSTIGKVDLDRQDDVETLVDRPVDAPEADLSPDGRFLVYQSSIGGPWQIRVLELATGSQWTVDEGFSPAWSLDGTALLYQVGTGAIKLLPVSTDAGFKPSTVTSLDVLTKVNTCCDLVDSRRFLALESQTLDSPATVVVNWPELLGSRR